MLLHSTHKAYMELALREAQKAMQKGEVPVGAVITNNQGIVAQAHNKVEEKQNACFHAEILAINMACKKLNTKFLDNCTLYVTLEPCNMCIQAIHTIRIKKLFWGAPITPYTKKLINNSSRQIELYEGIMKKESEGLINIFFNQLRKKNL